MSKIQSVWLYKEEQHMLSELMKIHAGKRIAATDSAMIRQAIDDKYCNDSNE